jgi:ABC-type branched-subunit amino acid transport system substrate-binding protein
MAKAGYDFTYTGVSELNIVNWGPLVDQVRQNDSTYVTMVYDVPGWAAFQRELAAQGVKVGVMEANAAEYTPEYLEQAGAAAEGTLIPLSTAPFEDAKRIPELKAYLKWVKKIDGEPTSLGIQGWSAGLLFATAAQSLGSDLTREGLITALQGIHAWDGNGIHVPADPGANVPSGCFVYMQVKNGKFVRLHPKQGFDCSNPKVVDIPADL